MIFSSVQKPCRFLGIHLNYIAVIYLIRYVRDSSMVPGP